MTWGTAAGSTGSRGGPLSYFGGADRRRAGRSPILRGKDRGSGQEGKGLYPSLFPIFAGDAPSRRFAARFP
jgi:hypothetical protein